MRRWNFFLLGHFDFDQFFIKHFVNSFLKCILF